MTSETEEILKNIARIIEGFRKDELAMELYQRIERLEKFLLTIEEFEE